MFTRHKSISKTLQLALTLSLLIMAAVIVTAVYGGTSAFSTINTDDGLVDTNWSTTPLVTDPLGDTDFDPWTDITRAWFGLDAPVPTEYYFRIEVGSGPIGNGGTAHIQLDCNHNGSFTDPTDSKINYWVGYEDPNDQLGAVWVEGPNGTVYTDDYGEVAAGTNYEIKAHASDLGLCAIPPFGIRFLTNHGADMTSPVSTPAYTTIEPDQGGTLVYTDAHGLTTTIQVPSNAFTETTTIVFTALPTATAPSSFSFAGRAFDLEAYRNNILLPILTFSPSATVTIHYTETDVIGLDEASLVLQYWNGSAWEDAACGPYDRHPDDNWLAVPICHLSRFALFGQKPRFAVYLPLVLQNYGACSTIPILISPANGSSPNTVAPLLRWDNGDNPSATRLRLQVARSPGFTQTVSSFSSNTTSGVREWRFPWNFDPATTYYWRAWFMCGETQGPYSDVWSFTTGSGGTILPAPSLVAPPNRSDVSTTMVTLQWSPVSGAVEYLVRWAEEDQGGYTFEWVNDTELAIYTRQNTMYEWWVSARNDYAVGTDSETWRFTTLDGSALPFQQDSSHGIVIEHGSTTIVLEDSNDD